MSAPFSIRPATADDLPFVRPNWVHTFEGSPVAISLNGVFPTRWSAVVDDLFGRATTLVATAPDEPALLLGFVCGEPGRDVLHYAYVKANFRHMGLARALCAEMFGERPVQWVTHRVGPGMAISQRRGWGFDFTRIWLP